MKKQILAATLVAGTFFAQAQTVVHDSVILGAGYANQVWYSMENDEQGSAPKNNWDIAFDIVDIMSSIHINAAGGAMLWNYPKGDKTAWASIDTNGLSTWDARYNSDTSWALGAMGNYKDPNNPFDIDWGIYDMATHKIHGDSIYIIKLVNGDYKKLFIELLSGGEFTFKFANLDGTGEVTDQVNKSQFTDKSLGYYSISGQTTLNREPDREKWDLVFTQYTGFVPIPYTVTGVLHNRHVEVAQADNIPNKGTYNSWQAHSFSTEINTIGYDWKTQSMGVYAMKDSLVYFVAVKKQAGNDIWKLIFTGFESADGKMVFDKQKLQTASINDINTGNTTTMALYPNPSNGRDVQVVYSLTERNTAVMLHVTDITGKTVFANQLDKNAGLHTYALPVALFAKGMYIVTVSTDGGHVQQKLSVN